ncbi:MAG: hypothetical protein HeimC3_37460 [Candidatus Heimdallarchaeota archaeon LC_3]|nr:MAG: hypothetical protein HeimC3_37460 [Candidatus Heimdallarchaeota archaeon LC_3]
MNLRPLNTKAKTILIYLIIIVIFISLIGGLTWFSFFFLSGGFNPPFYRETTTITVNLSEETEFILYLPILGIDPVAGSEIIIINATESYAELNYINPTLSIKELIANDEYEIEIVSKNMTILGRAINVTFMKIIGKESLTICQTNEYTPRTKISEERKIFSTVISGLGITDWEGSDIMGSHTTIYILFPELKSNQITANVFYSYSAKTNFAGVSADIEVLKLTHNATRNIKVEFGGFIA